MADEFEELLGEPTAIRPEPEEVTLEVTEPKKRGRPKKEPESVKVVLTRDEPAKEPEPKKEPEPTSHQASVSARTLAEIEAGRRAVAKLSR